MDYEESSSLEHFTALHGPHGEGVVDPDEIQLKRDELQIFNISSALARSVGYRLVPIKPHEPKLSFEELTQKLEQLQSRLPKYRPEDVRDYIEKYNRDNNLELEEDTLGYLTNVIMAELGWMGDKFKQHYIEFEMDRCMNEIRLRVHEAHLEPIKKAVLQAIELGEITHAETEVSGEERESAKEDQGSGLDNNIPSEEIQGGITESIPPFGESQQDDLFAVPPNS